MFNKRLQPANQFHGMPTAHLVGSFSKGLDTGVLEKVASSSKLLKLASNIKPEKGYSFVHLITTGAGERYSCNNNGDYFNKEARLVEFPNPAPGVAKHRMLDGGLKKYHHTFTKYAHVYREHNNSRKGAAPLGDVVLEAYNDEMDRGELIAKMPHTQWENEINKLASGKPVFFSMGAGVKSDICSECGNEAKVSSDYCDHVKYNKMQMTKEGNQVFMYNESPYFHDISGVETPADKIAFGLSKVASGAPVIETYQRSNGVYIPHSLVQKLAGDIIADRYKLLQKLAEMEKEITALALPGEQDKALVDSFSDEEIDPCACAKLAEGDLDDVLHESNKSEIMLPPESFMRIVMKKPNGDIDGLDEIREALPGVFSELLDAGPEAIQDGSYSPKEAIHRSGLKEVIEGLTGKHSLGDGPTQVRVITSSMRGPSIQKQANQLLKLTRTPSEQSKYLAKEYGKYQLSFLANNQKHARTIVLHNAHI